jgi:hypothetical protein
MTSIQDALTLLAEAEESVRRAREIVQKALPAVDQTEWVGGLILAELLKEGGSVKRNRLHELAAKYGMDNRGLGGFFTGKGSLHIVPGTDLVMLTPEGAKTAVRYLNKLGVVERDVDEMGDGPPAEDPLAEEWTENEGSDQ